MDLESISKEHTAKYQMYFQYLSPISGGSSVKGHTICVRNWTPAKGLQIETWTYHPYTHNSHINGFYWKTV